MSSFTAARLVPVGIDGPSGTPLHRVTGPEGNGFDFYIGSPTSGLTVHIADGFVTDVSIPRLLVRIMPRRLLTWVCFRLGKAAAVHDRLREDLQFKLIDCDALFLVAMLADGLSWKGGPGPWPRRLARSVLREIAFFAVRFSHSRQAP